MAWLRFNRAWDGAGRKFQEGQVIEVSHKICSKTGATLVDLATHRQWVKKGLCDLFDKDPTPAKVVKERQKRADQLLKEDFVEVEFIEDVATSNQHFQRGQNYRLPESKAIKYIERKLCVPCTKQRESQVVTGTETR